MEKKKIKEMCNEIKKNIDWEYDSYSGYQTMMETINNLADEIIKEVNE